MPRKIEFCISCGDQLMPDDPQVLCRNCDCPVCLVCASYENLCRSCYEGSDLEDL